MIGLFVARILVIAILSWTSFVIWDVTKNPHEGVLDYVFIILVLLSLYQLRNDFMALWIGSPVNPDDWERCLASKVKNYELYEDGVFWKCRGCKNACASYLTGEEAAPYLKQKEWDNDQRNRTTA